MNSKLLKVGVLSLISALSYSVYAQDLGSYNQGFNFENLKDAKVNGFIVLGEVGTAAFITARSSGGEDAKLLREAKSNLKSVQAVRRNAEAGTIRASANTPGGLASRMEAITTQVGELEVRITAIGGQRQLSDELVQIRRQLTELNRQVMSDLAGSRFEAAKEGIDKLAGAQARIAELTTSLNGLTVTRGSEAALTAQKARLESAIQELSRAVDTGTIKGAAIATYEAEAASLRKQITSLAQAEEAAQSQVKTIVERLRGKGLFGRLAGVSKIVVLADLILITDAAGQVGYITKVLEQGPIQTVGADQALLAIKEVTLRQ